jgi:hypothetical protein
MAELMDQPSAMCPALQPEPPLWLERPDHLAERHRSYTNGMIIVTGTAAPLMPPIDAATWR